jgi:hypothetical protein
MSEIAWRYAQARNHLIRWRGTAQPDAVPSELELLTSSGWHAMTRGLRRQLWADGRKDSGAEEADRFTVQACADTPIDADRSSGVCSRFAASRLRWILSPPLPMGAPRRLVRSRSTRAEKVFREELGDHASDRVLQQAIAGWERSRERHNGIESRSQAFLQAAGLTTTLVLANSALLRGQDRVQGAAAWIVIATLVLASATLLVAGVYGLFGSMFAFGRVAPNDVLRVLARAKEPDEELALQQQVAAVLLAQRRTSHVADWKLARLKRAMWWLLAGVLLLAIASGALVIDALA